MDAKKVFTVVLAVALAKVAVMMTGANRLLAAA